MILACLFLAWLFLPTKPEPVSIQPTDGLVEQVAVVKDSLTTDHIADAGKKVEAKKEIVIFTRSNCPPCDKWKRIEQPKFEHAGWRVAYCEQHSYGLTPTFLIDANGKQTEHRGYLAFDKINEVLK